MLIVNITPTGYYYYQSYTFMSRFEITVSNYYGLGIPNANVTAMYVVVQVQPGAGNNQGDVELKNVFVKTCLTDPVGMCTLDFTNDLQGVLKGQVKWFFPFLIVRAEWQGFVSIAGYGSTSTGEAPVQGYIIGNYVFLNRTIDITYIQHGNKNAGAVIVKDDLLQAVPEYQDLLNFTTVTWCRDSSGNFRYDDPLCNNAGRVLPSAKQWYLVGYIQYVEPLSSHIFIFAQFRGNPVAIVISRLPNIDIAYGGKTALPANSVTLRRVCTIYSYPYVVELTIWRRVEGFP
jgi:hypothetical protein